MIDTISSSNTPRNYLHFGRKYFIPFKTLFSQDILEKFRKFLNGEIDYLIIRDMPVSTNLPETPQAIRSKNYPPLESAILATVARQLGKISSKGIENTIRFNTQERKANVETWHSHFQYSASVFYCLRGDQAARTYFLAARQLVAIDFTIKKLLMTPFQYLDDIQPFALIEEDDNTYKFSRYIFDRSELEKYIQDLDLPDAAKALKRILSTDLEAGGKRAISYLLDQLENTEDFISYVPGDLILVNEQRVIRYSPSFRSENNPAESRWLIAVSVTR